MLKRIILLSDGTGNSASKVWKSNVWRIFESLDLRGSDQIAFYDDGVGTSSFKPLAILGGVFGWGLKRNVLDIYKFLCANYEKGDRIYGFGFSRGAFTIRVVIGLILSQGLVRGATDAELYRNAKMAYRAYRAERFHTVWHIEWPFRKLRDALLYLFGVRYDKTKNLPVDEIEFLGLWDTVAAYGLPIDEMARGVSKWIWPLELPNRNFDQRIKRACHALALDDERTTFHPVLWNEQEVPDGHLSQVWFAGVHSNVGGGYPDDSLAHIPLYWIMTEAQQRGLAFKVGHKPETPDAPQTTDNPDPDMMVFARWRRDKDGRLYDSRNGLGGYYRYGPRKIADLSRMRFSLRAGDFVANGEPTIHETAITRAIRGAHRYAPIGIPQSYKVLTDAGVKSQDQFESEADAEKRCEEQEHIWNLVWRRRIIYFVTIFASLYLALYPLMRTVPKADEYSTRLTMVSAAIRAVAQALPGFLSPWVEAYARDPSHFLFFAALVVLLVWIGVWLGTRIKDRMERIWRSSEPPGLSKLLVAAYVLGGGAASYALFQSYLPLGGEHAITSYVTTSVKIILVFMLLALFLPNRLVYHLRSWWIYRNSIRLLKQSILPALFAISFIGVALLFGSHAVFAIQEANGLVCEESPKIANATLHTRVNSYGLGSCLTASVASCSGASVPATCSGGRPVFCSQGAPSCERQRKPDCSDATSPDCYYVMPVCKITGAGASASTAGPATCPYQCEVGPRPTTKLQINKACNNTGIWLEQGQRYNIRITPDRPEDIPVGESEWKDNGINVSTRGLVTSTLSPAQRIVEMFKWPLKRHLFLEPFKVVARVGSVGSNEFVLEPDDDPDAAALDVNIVPKRSGELFLYVNEAVWGWPFHNEYFYQDNEGTATIAVQRQRR